MRPESPSLLLSMLLLLARTITTTGIYFPTYHAANGTIFVVFIEVVVSRAAPRNVPYVLNRTA